MGNANRIAARARGEGGRERGRRDAATVQLLLPSVFIPRSLGGGSGGEGGGVSPHS